MLCYITYFSNFVRLSVFVFVRLIVNICTFLFVSLYSCLFVWLYSCPLRLWTVYPCLVTNVLSYGILWFLTCIKYTSRKHLFVNYRVKIKKDTCSLFIIKRMIMHFSVKYNYYDKIIIQTDASYYRPWNPVFLLSKFETQQHIRQHFFFMSINFTGWGWV